jgi:hypothetical protein
VGISLSLATLPAFAPASSFFLQFNHCAPSCWGQCSDLVCPCPAHLQAGEWNCGMIDTDSTVFRCTHTSVCEVGLHVSSVNLHALLHSAVQRHLHRLQQIDVCQLSCMCVAMMLHNTTITERPTKTLNPADNLYITTHKMSHTEMHKRMLLTAYT